MEKGMLELHTVVCRHDSSQLEINLADFVMTYCSIFQWKLGWRYHLTITQHFLRNRNGRLWLGLYTLLNLVNVHPFLFIEVIDFSICVFCSWNWVKEVIDSRIRMCLRTLRSALLWELNSIDGGIFRCHLWAQFFWCSTSLSTLTTQELTWVILILERVS